MNKKKIYNIYFVNYLKIERGLAENSIFAYQSDLEKLSDFCIARSIAPKEVDLETLKGFVADLYDLGLSARSQARVISGVKQFFDFLVLEGVRDEDPSRSEERRVGKECRVRMWR